MPSGGGTSGQGVYGRTGLPRMNEKASLKVKHYRKLDKRSCCGLETNERRPGNAAIASRPTRSHPLQRRSHRQAEEQRTKHGYCIVTDKRKSPSRTYTRVEGRCLIGWDARSGFLVTLGADFW